MTYVTPHQGRIDAERGDAGTDQTTSRVIAGGSMFESIGGAGAVVLGILGLSGMFPFYLAAIATIAAGGALLAHGGAIATRWRAIVSELGSTDTVQGGMGGGLGAEVFGGAAGVTLGILALANVLPAILLPVAAIVLGGGILLGGAAQAELADLRLGPEFSAEQRRVLRESARATSAGEALAGIGGVVLGILALINVAPYLPMVLVSMLAVGGSMLLAGSVTFGRVVRHATA